MNDFERMLNSTNKASYNKGFRHGGLAATVGYMIIALIVLLNTVTTAHCETKPMYSLQSIGTTDTACGEAKGVAISILDKLPTTTEHIFVVCQDREFDGIAKGYSSPTPNAFSVKIKGEWIIFIRAGAMLRDRRLNETNPGYTPRHVIAHEFGHIKTGSNFEEAAENWAKNWIQ